MRILHLLQPTSCPAPPWNSNDQRSDAPCHLVAALCASRGLATHSSIIIGGTHAAADALACGLRADHLAPALGLSLLVTRRLAPLMRALSRDDVVVGWGSQFRSVLDLARPRSARLCVDLRTGRLWGRGADGPDWEEGDVLPARVGLTQPHAPLKSAKITSGPITVGLCDDGPTSAPTVSFAFALGVLAAAGFDVTPVIRRTSRDLARLVRHTREGGRLLTPIVFDGPIAPRAAACDWWLCSLPTRAEHTDRPYTDWCTLLLADVLARRGASVLGIGDGCGWMSEETAPRITRLPGRALSEASAGLLRALGAGPAPWTGETATDACGALNSAAWRIARGESLAAKRERAYAG